MVYKRSSSIITICMTLMLVFLLAFPVRVFAQDEVPTATPDPVITVPTDAPVETTPVVTEVPVDLLAVTDVPSETQVAAPEITETPSVVENPTLIADTVIALQDAGAVLLDVEGSPIPLASQAAADILSAPDPVGCAPGVTPDWMGGTGVAGVNCTANYLSIQAALNDALVVNGWTIFIQQGAYSEDVTVSKSVKFTGLGTGATANKITLNTDIDNLSSWFSAPLVIVNPGASIADGINLVAPGGTVRTSVYIYQGTTDSSGVLTAAVRDNSSNASPTYQLECGEPNVTMSLGATYNMILMDPFNPVVVNYYTSDDATDFNTSISGTQELHDLCIAVNLANQNPGSWASTSAADQYEQHQVYWKVLNKIAGVGAFSSLVTDIQNGTYNNVPKTKGVYFMVTTAGNAGTTPAPTYAQLTFITNCDDGNPATINIQNADGSCTFTPKTCNDGFAATADSLNPNGTCSFTCINGATNAPTCTTCTSGNTLINGTCVPIITGCMDETAFNYNRLANTAGTCEPVVTGCMDAAATNFDQSANVAGTCTYQPTTPPLTIIPLLIPVTGNTCVPDVITAGIGHTCAITPLTGLRCWGQNDAGQLGDGSQKANSTLPVKTKVLDGGEVVQLVSGTKHTCALTSGNDVMCWGLNYSGQLGNGTTTNSNIPVKVKGLQGTIISISAGENFTCAVNSDNITMCWGNNSGGQFKNGNDNSTSTPVVANLGSDVKLVSGGQSELQGVTNAGAVTFWSNQLTIPVTGLSSGVALVSADRFSEGGCAMTTEGKVECWGAITASGITDAKVPTELETGRKTCKVDPLITGEGHGCTITKDNGLVCWGKNVSGQLGNGTQVDSETPVKVTGIQNILHLAAGFDHTCAIVDQETIKCWGQNTYGQLGNGTTKESSLPVLVK